MDRVLSIQNKLTAIGKQVYIVWGFCRDQILGVYDWWDIDLSTNARPEEVSAVLKVIGVVGKKYGTCIIREWWEVFEITTFREDIGSLNNRKPAEVVFTDSLEKDAQRRDFSCNSIYYNPITQTYIDPQNGIHDIHNNIIRFVWNIEERIFEDALRILRCIRFKNKYNFSFAEDNYLKILKAHIHLLKNISIERIRQELDAILQDKNNHLAIEDLKQIWFLALFLPELYLWDLIRQNKSDWGWNIWIATKLCLQEMYMICKREKIVWEKKRVLLWAALLQGIWKHPRYSIANNKEWSQQDHTDMWAFLLQEYIAKKMKFSKHFQKIIFFLIQEQSNLWEIPNMELLASRKLMMHDSFPDLLLLAEANQKWSSLLKTDTLKKIIKIYNDFQIIVPSKQFLTGADIIQKYPDLQWAKIGERLEQVNNQILISDGH